MKRQLREGLGLDVKATNEKVLEKLKERVSSPSVLFSEHFYT